MRIAFVGKGGSGKTTLASLLSRYIAGRGFPILAIDADINQHLAMSLGMDEKDAQHIPALGNNVDVIKQFLRGKNTRSLSDELMIKTTPPGAGSRLMRLVEDNPMYEQFERWIGDVRLLAVGAFTENDLGTKCYHSKTGAVELLLNHLVDAPSEYVVVDMTAGSDSFASGMFTKFDLTCLVVEPTLKSISVYTQYKKYAEEFDVNIKVVGNKVETAEDEEFIKSRVGDDLTALFKKSDFVKATERGSYSPLRALEADNSHALDQILAALDTCKKDWNKFYKQTIAFHLQNSESWANAQLGADLSLQIDPTFIFPTIP